MNSTPGSTSLALASEPVAITPMQMLQMAVSQGADLDKLQKLMELQERWEANEARKAYERDFSAFKAESIRIVRNVAVTAGPLQGKSYADLFQVVSSLTGALSRHNLSSSWKTTKDDPNWIEVTCTIRHVLGHSESVSMGGPPDAGGAKNAIQARASTTTYLQRYTLLSATGMAAAGQDTDGNKPKGSEMDEREFANFLEGIENGATVEDSKLIFGDAYKAAKAIDDKGAMSSFQKAWEKRKVQR